MLFFLSLCYTFIMNQDKLKKEIDYISRQIAKKYKPKKIILFGSAVSGKFTKDSDLDFFIIKEDVPYLGRDRARELRRMIVKHMAADFLIYKQEEFDDWFEAKDPFLETIVNEGKVLYES